MIVSRQGRNDAIIYDIQYDLLGQIPNCFYTVFGRHEARLSLIDYAAFSKKDKMDTFKFDKPEKL